jgi:hypothetical protein
MSNYPKSRTQLSRWVQRLGIITDDVKAAALGGSLRTECADNDMSPRFYCACNLPNVRGPMTCRGEKVKHRAVMPNVVSGKRQIALRDVCNQPVHPVRSMAQSFPVRIDGSPRVKSH